MGCCILISAAILGTIPYFSLCLNDTKGGCAEPTRGRRFTVKSAIEGIEMGIGEFERNEEGKWLDHVIETARIQLARKREAEEKVKSEAIETQRELWDQVGAISSANGLEQLTDFIGYVNEMKRQKVSYTFIEELSRKYERLTSSPYFGRIDFIENGDGKAARYYIGISNLMDDNYDILVYDWRSPVASMFYDCQIGDAGYRCPAGMINGKLTLKRQYRISGGRIEYMFDSNLKIDDEILQEILGRSTDGRMNAIVGTIQKEQNRAIRNEEYKNLIVQGPAGSGKTSIALHRVAYLLYKHRDRITSQNMMIFSPNEIFNDYISNVLPQLGEENMLRTTFGEYMSASLGGDLKKEKYCDMMEYILSARDRPTYKQRIANIRYKTSLEFTDVLKRYVSYVEGMNRNFADIVFRGRLVISGKDLADLYYRDYRQMPLKRRLGRIRDRILFLLEPYKKERTEEIIDRLRESDVYIDQVEVAEKSIGIVKDELKYIYSEIDRITEFDPLGVYRELFETPGLLCAGADDGIEDIKAYTLENLECGQIYYEDQIPLLYLKCTLGDLPVTSSIKYVIIDEAQDYTPLQIEIFNLLFKSASITLLGDLDQSINPFMNVGSFEGVFHIFSRDNTCMINLTKSYRSTEEITGFSRMLLKEKVVGETVARHGDEPLVLGFSNEGEISARVLEDIKKYTGIGYKSIGIITRTKKEAARAYGLLKDQARIREITGDGDEYISGTVIIPGYLAKGLEFDVVIVYDEGNGNYRCGDERRLLYTVCSRALHVLCVYYSGECTPLLKGARLN